MFHSGTIRLRFRQMRNILAFLYSISNALALIVIITMSLPCKESLSIWKMISLMLIVYAAYCLDERYHRSAKGISLSPGILAGTFLITTEPYFGFLFCIIGHSLAHLTVGRKNNFFNLLLICQEGIACYFASVSAFYLQNAFQLNDASFRLLAFVLIYESSESILYYTLSSVLARSKAVFNEIRDSILSISISISIGYLMIGLYQSFEIIGIVITGLIMIPLNYIVDMFYQGFRHKEQLISANNRLELLQESIELLKDSGGKKDGYRTVLKRISDYFEFDAAIMAISGVSENVVAIINEGETDASEIDIKEWLTKRINGNRLGKMETNSRKKSRKDRIFLNSSSSIQLIIPLSTKEIVLGTAVFEKISEIPPRKGEIRMLMNIVHQVSIQIHDNIMRKELFESNFNLSRKSRQLADILEIGNELKTDLNIESLLDKIAKFVKNDLGFKTVLFSLIDESGTNFIRAAQAGLDNIWDDIKDMKVPREEITNYFKDVFLFSKSYYVNHFFAKKSDYTIKTGKTTEELPGNWNQNDMLLIPVKNTNGKLIGVISCDNPDDEKVPDIETIQALEIFANQAATAIEGARAYEQMKTLGIKDGLTGLFNHRHFQETLKEMIDFHAAESKELGLLMVDLDDFKSINDNYGHPAGDLVLMQLSEILQKNVRNKDFLARYGGEEFVVIFSDITKELAVTASDRIRKTLGSTRIDISGVSMRITVSLGLAFYPSDAETREKLIALADEALYRAKKSGKNRLHLAGDTFRDLFSMD